MFREAEPHDLLVEAYRHRNDAVLARQKLASAPTNESKTARWIGVSVNPADETLRAHLKLAEGAGLVVSDVIKDAPAAKAGLLKNDVLIAIKDHQLGTPEDLVKAVAESKVEAKLAIRLRRKGAEQVITVLPEPRPRPKQDQAVGDEASAQAHAAYKGTLQLQYYQPYYNMALPQMMGSTDANVALVLTRLNGLRSVAESTKAKEDRSEAQIVALSKQVEALTKVVEALKDRLPEKGEDK